MTAPLPVAVTASVILASLAIFTVGELLFPLRASVEAYGRRLARNAAVAAAAYALTTLVTLALFTPLAAALAQRRVGLLHLFPLPAAMHTLAAILLLDYTLWHWHWLNHKVPFFWRFHLVHHTDLDLTASTALRFHAGELVLSLFYRLLQIAVIGADPLALSLWQMLLFAAVLFHHSNWRLAFPLEKILVRLIVTPRMHGIHHSDQRAETDSNYCSILSLWDRLHGTLILNIPQREIVIGVAGWRKPEELTMGKILLMPLRRQRDDWPAGAPQRDLPKPRTRLSR